MSNLENVSVGDELYISHNRTSRFAKVTRITPTQILAGTDRFRKKDGYGVGRGAWDFTSARLATPEDKVAVAERIARNNAIAKIKRARLSGLSTETLVEISNLIGDEK